MEDQEIRGLIEDLASVGLSDNPGILVKGENGIVKIQRSVGNFDADLEDFPMIKGMDRDLTRIGRGIIFLRVLSDNPARYTIEYQDKNQAKAALARITAYLNS